MRKIGVRTLTIGSAIFALTTFSSSSAQTIERIKASDPGLECPAIQQENRSLDSVVAAGDPNRNVVGKTAAGAAAGVGGQVAGSLLGGMFGGLGQIIGGQAGNVAARQATESSMAPDAVARQRADEALARKDFLARLGAAKGCKSDDPAFAGRSLSPEEFQQLASAAPAGKLDKLTPLTLASVTPALSEPVSPYPANDLVEGKVDLRGKRFYVAEFRVLFDVAGRVSANTRAGYLPGRDYGATNVRVNYSLPNIDIAALQAITDKAYEDFRARLTAAGVKLEDAETFVRENGAVYEATEQASRPGAPVFYEKNLGHAERKYLVMSPTGMKTLSRGIIGIGAGNIGKRVEWTRGNLEALSINMAVNLAALETSGSGSSILRSGSSANAKEGMSVTSGPDTVLLQSHAHTNMLRMKKALAVEGNFANFRETGGYDSSKDVVARTAGVLSNLGGLGANQSKRVDLEVDVDGPSMSRMALRGLVTLNEAVASHIKSGL